MKQDILTRTKKRKVAALLQENCLDEARVLGEQLLCSNRADVETLVLLGMIYSRLGNDNEAESYCRRALQHGPKRAELHHALGAVLQRQTKMQEALEYYRSAIHLNPKLFDAHFQLGNILRELGQFDQAAGYFRAVLFLDPNYVPALCNLGGTLATLHQYDEAAIHLNQAYQLMPEATPVLCNMARVMQELGKPEEAELRCREALRINPLAVDAISILAELLEKSHRMDEAHELVKRGLEVAPGHFLLRYAAAKLARTEGRYQDAVAIAESILGDSPSADSKAELHFLLGQLYDRLDDVDRAYGHFAEANRIVAMECTGDYTDLGGYLRRIGQYREQFKAVQPVAVKAEHIDEDQGSPVFLVGFPRSGTTLLEQILDSHAQIQSLDERPTVAVMAKAYEGIVARRPDAADKLTREEIQALRKVYFDEVSQHVTLEPGQTVLDKLPLNLIQAHLIWRIFPRAKFILAIRHPCDAVLSCFMQNFALNQAMISFTSLENTAAVYAGLMQLWREYAAHLNLQHHIVRYEDVVENVEDEARRLLGFLELAWDDAVLDHVAHARRRGNISTPSYHQVTQPIYRHATHRWKRYAREMKPVMETLQPFIEYFGYGDIS